MGLSRNQTLLVSVATAGLVATFIGMLATGHSGPIGTVMYVPWIALLASQLGPAIGALAGVVATALYFAAAQELDLPHDPASLALVSPRSSELESQPVFLPAASRRTHSSCSQRAHSSERCSTRRSTASASPTLAGNLVLANAPLKRFAAELGLPEHGTVAQSAALARRPDDRAGSLQRAHGNPRKRALRERRRVRADREPDASSVATPRRSPGRTARSSHGSGRSGR